MTANSPEPRSLAKRSRVDDDQEEKQNGAEASSDEDIGPAPPAAGPKRKRRKLPYERLYVAALPKSARYSKSLMHRDQLCFITLTPTTDFLITSSIDGVIKFWKVVGGGTEFVKEFRAHNGEIKSTSTSTEGRSFASAGADQTVKIFDVVNFDLVSVLTLEFAPRCVCWVHKRGSSMPLLAVSSEEDCKIRIYDGRGENQQPLHTLDRLHRSSVVAMSFNNDYDCVVSADSTGMVEYWQPHGAYSKPDSVFQIKSSTNLFEFKRSKSVPVSITMSPSCDQFATTSFPDRKVRVFNFASGRVHRTYDESLPTITDMQQAGTAAHKLEEVEFDAGWPWSENWRIHLSAIESTSSSTRPATSSYTARFTASKLLTLLRIG